MSFYDSSYDKLQSGPLFQEDRDYIKKICTELLPIDSKKLRKGYRLPDSKKKGYSSIYINEICHLQNNDKVYDKIHPALNTLDLIFNYVCDFFADKDCFGERKLHNGKYDDFFTFESFKVIAQRRMNIGAGFLHLVSSSGLGLGNKFVLTIYSSNRLEWLLTDIACHAYDITSTLLYDTLGPESAKHILSLTESPIVVCSKDKFDKLFALKKELPLLKCIVSMDKLNSSDDEFIKKFKDAGVTVMDFASVEALGKANPKQKTSPTPDSIFTISFTSGTTGLPKGVVLTHRTMAAVVTFNAIHLKRNERLGNDRIFSFLPLAHIFERTSLNIYMLAGLVTAFPSKDDTLATLIETLKILKPVVLVGVPRLFNKLESGIKSKTENSKLLTKIIDQKIARQELKDDERAESFFVDKLIISKLRNAVGFDNIEYCITGSAPINPGTVKFLKLALGIGFSQGFGATETCGGCMISDVFELKPGSCGAIGACAQLKLKTLPELNYSVEDADGNELDEPTGEILLRGQQIFDGYYKDELNTKLAFDDEGWYHTGDVARIDKLGRVHIIDRVKNFFKLSQGEFIVPEKIENIYLSNNSIISQLYVHGDTTQTHLVGVVGIDKPILEAILSKNDFQIPKTQDELIKIVNTTDFKKIILKMLNNDKVNVNLSGFEKLQNIHIDIEPLKLSDDVITPTLKIKRNKAKLVFRDILDALYEEGKILTTLKL